MKIDDTRQIKNISLIGATNVGKTLLIKRILFHQHQGEEMASHFDQHPFERSNGYSGFSALYHYNGFHSKLNFLDTPGLADFYGEIRSAIRATDTAILVVNAQYGLDKQTEDILAQAIQMDKPIIVAVNQLDHTQASYDYALSSLQEKYDELLVQVQYPLDQGEDFSSIIDLIQMVMYRFSNTSGEMERLPIPDSEVYEAKMFHNILLEKIAECDEQLMEQYLNTGSLNETDIIRGLKKGLVARTIVPVFCMSAHLNKGVTQFTSILEKICPSPVDVTPEVSTENKPIYYSQTEPAVIFIYQSQLEPEIGKFSYFKVISGIVFSSSSTLVNAETGELESLEQLYLVNGSKFTPVGKLVAGDLGMTLHLKHAYPNQTWHEADHSVVIKKTSFPEAIVKTTLSGLKSGDEKKLIEALELYNLEDPSFSFEYDEEAEHVIIHTLGDFHTKIIQWQLESFYRIKTSIGKPKTLFKEAIRKTAEAFGKLEGDGGHASLLLKVIPVTMPPVENAKVYNKEMLTLPWGNICHFYNYAHPKDIPHRFIPIIIHGINDRLCINPINGSHSSDIQVSLMEGHIDESWEDKFKLRQLASSLLEKAFSQADPYLLEPITTVHIYIPKKDLLESILSELQQRHSLILEIGKKRNQIVITAKIPQQKMFLFSYTLITITKGTGMLELGETTYTLSIEAQENTFKKTRHAGDWPQNALNQTSL